MMTKPSALLLVLFTPLSLLPSLAAGPDFAREVQPILEGACVRCHGAEKSRGELRLHTREALMKGGETEAAVIPGKPNDSYLIELVSVDHDHELIMPAKGDPLTRREVHVLSEWILAGAPWPDGVVLEKKERASEAAKANKYAVLEELGMHTSQASAQTDKLIDYDNRDRQEVVKAEMLDDFSFLRKVYVDLSGRIPTLDEIMEFRKWPAAERRSKVVDKLLDDDRFNDRWTIFYADMLRIRSNADGGNQLLAYVNQSLRERKPYDELARELIATNGRPSDHPAAAFALAEDADPLEMAAVTAQTFLGVRLGCAMCHNHPFDEWDQKQFYEMASFFGKTKRIENNFGARMVYTTEGNEDRVLWPPEREKPPERHAVPPKFPFTYEDAGDVAPPHIARLNKKRSEQSKSKTATAVVAKLDDLLDIDAGPKKKNMIEGLDVVGELAKDKAAIDIEGDLYRPSELRQELAEKITDPRNRYFSRALANRVWAELMGRGFFEPVDNFTDITQVSHPKTMEHLADEFVASGYDIRAIIKIIVQTEAYQRSQLDGSLEREVREASQLAYTAGIPRRMLSEVLYDSVVSAGHLFTLKWPKGANIKDVEKQIRVNLDPETDEELPPAAAPGATPAMAGGNMMANTMAMGAKPAMSRTAYDLEKGLEVDFTKALAKKDVGEDLAMMKQMSDMQLKRDQERQAMMERRRRPQRYTYKTITETIDDNPSYTTAMRMQSPAPPAHFLRVFGQTPRNTLGEFREQGPSMRQALMMLNGKMTHEAARVGQLETLYDMLDPKAPQIEKAIKYAYLEILTRMPSSDEVSTATEVVQSYETDYRNGMADLRWALLNCHEFRYIP